MLAGDGGLLNFIPLFDGSANVSCIFWPRVLGSAKFGTMPPGMNPLLASPTISKPFLPVILVPLATSSEEGSVPLSKFFKKSACFFTGFK